jgi:DNA-directed RNA polymerase specialized sigma24 family protein
MSVEHGAGPAWDERAADALRNAGPHPLEYLYESVAVPLFDYCAGVLDDPLAACDTVQDSLVAVDAGITSFPEPGRLRVSLYATAHRLCQRRLSGSGAAPGGPGATAASGPDELDLAVLDEAAAGGDRETLAVVTAALAALPGRDREVLNLALRHAIKGADLAQVLALSPYRARSLLTAASARFTRVAAVAAVLGAGPAGCRALAGIARQPEPGSARIGARIRRHVASCRDCARVLGGRAFGPELIGEVPLEPPVGRLALRVTRTARALGAYRGKLVPLPDIPDAPARPDEPDQGSPPAPGRRRRGSLRAVAASSAAALAVLAVLGVLALRHELTFLTGPRSLSVKAASRVQRPAGAAEPAPALIVPVPSPSAGAHAPKRAALLPLLPQAPFGVLPTASSPAGSSPAPSHAAPKPSRTSPAPSHSTSPAPKKSTPPPTSPPPSKSPSPKPSSSPTPSPSKTVGK